MTTSISPKNKEKQKAAEEESSAVMPENKKLATRNTKAFVSEATGDDNLKIEKSLIEATRMLLREHGIRKSAAAVRDAVDKTHEDFNPEQAVSALSKMGFKSSFGKINISKLSDNLFPLVAFHQDGHAMLLKRNPDSDGFLGVDQHEPAKTKIFDKADLNKEFSGYYIIAKKLNQREEEERSGDAEAARADASATESERGLLNFETSHPA